MRRVILLLAFSSLVSTTFGQTAPVVSNVRAWCVALNHDSKCLGQLL